ERSQIVERERVVEARGRSLEQTWDRKYAGKIAELERRAAELSTQFEQRAKETIEDLSQTALSQKARAKIAKTSREFQESVDSLSSSRDARPTQQSAPPPK